MGAAVQALRGETRQARNGFTDRLIRQLADIFRRHRFNDLGRISLEGDRVLKAGPEPRHRDGFDRCGVLCEGAARGERQNGKARGPQQRATARIR